MLTKILFLGDVMAGENLFHLGRGLMSKFKKNYQNLIAFNSKELFDVDFIFYNFEYSLCEKEKNNTSGVLNRIYKASTDSLDIFPSNTTKIINVANNHFAQHGKLQTDFTLRTLIKKNYLITGLNNKPLNIEHKGHTIKFWGVSLIQDSNHNDLYFLSDYDNLLSNLELPQNPSDDIWIISIHWGEEYCSNPSKNQKNLAQQLIEKGFDIIVGHHPHVIQPVEFYKNKPIFFSLGNFIFDQNFSKKTQKGLTVKSSIFSKNHIDSDYYYTYQKRYFVSKLENVKESDLAIIRDSYFNAKIKYKILMKLEYLINIFRTDPSVLFNLIRKQFIKS